MSIRDRFNKFAGKTRFVACRAFIHLAGEEVTPLLGTLNHIGRNAIDSEGDIRVMGEGLVEICQSLLDMKIYWQSAANEGDVFWNEGEAGDYVNALFTDSAQRYLAQTDFTTSSTEKDELLSLPATENLVVMIIIAATGEIPDLETDLASMEGLEYGLKAIINLHYQERLEAIQIHFSPARLGDKLTEEQLLLNFSELIPL
jgi:hypothetical protein